LIAWVHWSGDSAIRASGAEVYSETGKIIFSARFHPESSENTAEPNICSYQGELPSYVAEFKIINPRKFGSVEVDNLLVEQIAMDKDIADAGPIFRARTLTEITRLLKRLILS